MTRVSTFQSNQSALLNLQRAQNRQASAGEQVSTGMKATDLRGFGRTAESVAALKSVSARVEGWIDQGELLSGRLGMQDIMLNRTSEAAANAAEAIGQALASDRGETFMTSMAAAFSQAAEALNAKHEGKYLFAGARLEEAPLNADALSDLTFVPAADLFRNDQLKASTRLGEGSVIQTGELADEIGQELMDVFRRVQAFAEGPDGNFTHPLTAAQKTFLQTELPNFRKAGAGVTEITARNGAVERRVEDTMKDLKNRSTSLKVLIGDRTEVDMAEAISNLQAADIAVQASAQVFATLRGSSLLDLLR